MSVPEQVSESRTGYQPDTVVILAVMNIFFYCDLPLLNIFMTLGGAGGEGSPVCQLPPAAHGEGDGNRGASTGLK
jgi:hypothetical protein